LITEQIPEGETEFEKKDRKGKGGRIKPPQNERENDVCQQTGSQGRGRKRTGGQTVVFGMHVTETAGGTTAKTFPKGGNRPEGTE